MRKFFELLALSLRQKIRFAPPGWRGFTTNGKDTRNNDMESTRRIHTLGTSNRTLEEFFAVLDTYNIRHVIDVRRFPKSRRCPWFDRETLEVELQSKGFEYLWLGDLLGGFREGGYEAYKMEMAYLRGLEEVERAAIRSMVALICAEKFPWKCHRLRIAGSLEERGWDVIHILDGDRIWQQKQASFEF